MTGNALALCITKPSAALVLYVQDKWARCLPRGRVWIKVRSNMHGADAEAGGKLASTQIIICLHTYAVVERRRSGSKIRSATNGTNTRFSMLASKQRAPNHLCPQEMADPPTSAPHMCEHTRGSRAGMIKSARLRCATAPRMCECSFSGKISVLRNDRNTNVYPCF